MLGIKDLIVALSDYNKIKKVVDFSWQKEFINGRYYRVKVTAVDKDIRGTGAFRKLISPRINFCDEKNIPMVLETHDESNVGLYEHFGFELVKIITSPKTDIKQYCFIRWPRI